MTTKYFGIFFLSKMKASDAVSYILSMTTDQIVNNYTLWSTNCPRAEHFISIWFSLKTSRKHTHQLHCNIFCQLETSSQRFRDWNKMFRSRTISTSKGIIEGPESRTDRALENAYKYCPSRNVTRQISGH